MQRGNVLVIGNSGAGKSTLINAVLGEDQAVTGGGTKRTTKALSIHESEEISFRLIDTIGFEPSFFKQQNAINAVKKWSKNSVKKGGEDSKINVIWFCVEGTSRKLFPKTINDLLRATSMWKSVPVIVVITKSYAIPDRQENIDLVNNAFASQKRYSKNLRKVIPVVASTYVLNDNAYAPPEGITELIDATNNLMPEGIKAAEADVSRFNLNRKRALAHGTVGIFTTSGVVVGAVPISFADALILTPLEVAEINALAQIYGIRKNEKSKQLFDTILQAGAVATIGKTAVSALKSIPGINLGASAINAIIAGTIVATLGEGSIYIFEKVYLGEISIDDIDWVKKVMETKFSTQFIEIIKIIGEKITDKMDDQTIAKIIADIVAQYFNPTSKK